MRVDKYKLAGKTQTDGFGKKNSFLPFDILIPNDKIMRTGNL